MDGWRGCSGELSMDAGGALYKRLHLRLHEEGADAMNQCWKTLF